ncbi:hypothetical protein EFB14_04165 [Rhizobium fabae]|uniref:Uncharacterized protein n=1 Tax=Rhizobium fabae TaxID=573179 RepID=A0A7W6B314_9HYPH|nr:hypothetical protein [Rhizobium fabae]RUM15257.1 hypothetical protein EFB14_04165 [Rhizobium fabae]
MPPPTDFAIFLKNNFPAETADVSDILVLNRPNRPTLAASPACYVPALAAGGTAEFIRLNENP